MERIALMRLKKDFWADDWIGPDAHEYCMKHGKVHLANRAGDIFVMRERDVARCETQSRWSFDAYELNKLKQWAREGGNPPEVKISLDSSIFECFQMRQRYCGQYPKCKDLEFIRFIDGDTPIRLISEK